MAHAVPPSLGARCNAWLVSYLLVNAVLLAIPVLINVEWPAASDARFFLGAALVAQLGTMMLVVGLPVWLMDRVPLLRPVALPSLFVLTLLWWVLIVVDARVFNQFGFHINGLVIALMFDGGLLGQLGLSSGTWLLAGLAVGVVAACQYLLVRILRARRHAGVRWRWMALVVPMVALSQGLGIWYDAQGRTDAMAGLRAIPWLQTATARRQMARLGWAADDRSQVRLATQPAANAALSYPRAALQCQPQRLSNVLVIVVDSLRHDMLTTEQMPNTARFAADAWQGNQHYSTGNNTMHGVFGLFYGLPALYTQTMIHHRRGPELLRQLQRYNYAFHLYGGASLAGARLDRAVFVETDAPLHTASPQVAPDERDRDVVGQMTAALRGQPADQPFFGFILLDSAHAPYAVPAEAEQRFLPQASAGAHFKTGRSTDPKPLFNRYRNAVLGADARIGELLQALDDTGRSDDTVVIITSDHGESFNDLGQNDWGHNSNFSDVQTRVPMLVRWPGRAPAQEPAVTSHMDVAPTLMRHLLSCTNPPADFAAGVDLFGPLPAQRPLLVESWTSRAVRLGDETLLVRPYGMEVRDKDYQPIKDSHAPATATAVILQQMQLLNAGALHSPTAADPTG
ncbi:hypothetical protein EDF77_2042 [Stenotrophomonas maltophilia]|nr:sulfatase-like hydrolase/transferase [Stenotrophomonas chelatiphaga]ROQ42564.1 hypothetical protein EDF77_2042 [Stenotrophomonas maltophilia]